MASSTTAATAETTTSLDTDTSSSSIFSLQGKALKFDSTTSISPYLSQLSHYPTLTELIISGNTLGIEASTALAETITSNRSRWSSTLKRVDFSDIFTGRLISEIPIALKALCTSLLNIENLEELDLSDNAFGGRSAEPMLEFISTHPNLKILKLNNNGMGPAGGKLIAEALLKNAEHHRKAGKPSTLHTIICGRNRLENGSSQAFAEAFKALKSLQQVRLPQNGIRMEGIEIIVKALQDNPNLQILDLQDNTATFKGSKAIASSLKSWPNLKILNLSDCLLRSKGAYQIMIQFQLLSNPKLETLKLQSNEMGSSPLLALAKAIESGGLNELNTLELNGNFEDDQGYEKIREALGKVGKGEGVLDELDELEEVDEDEEEEEGESDDDDDDDDDDGKEGEKKTIEETKEEIEQEDELSKALGKVHLE